MLDISTEKNSNTNMLVLTLAGEIDHSQTARIREYFQKTTDEAPKALIIDITKISYMDSSGIGLLIAFNTLLKEAGITMAVVINSENHLMQKFRHLGIFNGPGIPTSESLEEAEAAIRSQ